MIDLLLMGGAFIVLVWVMTQSMKRRGFPTDPVHPDMIPPGKKFTVKIVSDYGEKAEFASLEEKDIKQIIETLVALKKHREEGENKG